MNYDIYENIYKLILTYIKIYMNFYTWFHNEKNDGWG